MARVFNLGDILQLVDDGFYQCTFAQQDPISQQHRLAIHRVGAQFRDQLQAEGLAQQFIERFGYVAFVAKELAEQLAHQLGDRFAVIDIAGREQHVEQLTPIIDHHVKTHQSLS